VWRSKREGSGVRDQGTGKPAEFCAWLFPVPECEGPVAPGESAEGPRLNRLRKNSGIWVVLRRTGSPWLKPPPILSAFYGG